MVETVSDPSRPGELLDARATPEFEFRDLVPVEGRWNQRVLVVGGDGVPVVADYVMEQQPDGTWRIDGCVIERSNEQTT